MTNTVLIDRCQSYDEAAVEAILERHLDKMSPDDQFFSGKTVVIKPNLLAPSSPEKSAVTHPAVICAAAKILLKRGAKEVILAESPGGPYTEAMLRMNYRSNGILALEKQCGIKLNYDTSYTRISAPNGKIVRMFDVINPILNADIVINICKLKTHSLAMMSAAVKNLFGVVPGIQKFQLHAQFSDQTVFMNALVDLCQTICEKKPCLHICDAVIGMEGNGPLGGKPKEIGYLISSDNPYALDLTCAEILGLSGRAPMLNFAIERKLCPKTVKDLLLDGAITADMLKISGYKLPETSKKSKFDFLPDFLKPRPKINEKKCIGCAKCAESCPAKIITVTNKKANIAKNGCIRCFCCQELCPVHAVDIQRNIIFRLIP